MEIQQRNQPQGKRLIELDVLRCLAILLVLFAHVSHLELDAAQVETLSAFRPFFDAGWIGVPIFFVLSGFLISNLLIREFEKTGTIHFKRFFIRRGFKIYPAFYLCIFLYSAYLLVADGGIDLERFFREIFFIQNYGKGGLIDVSWSLGVEEHFYILFPLVLLALIRFNRSTGRDISTFRLLPAIAMATVILCLVLRLDAYTSYPDDTVRNHFGTHLRIDALFVGAAFAYLYNAHRDLVVKIFTRFRLPALALSIIIFLGATYQTSTAEEYRSAVWFIRTYYLIFLSAASVGILGVALSRRLPPTRVWNFAAYLGRHSYSIYLFHIPFIRLLNKVSHVTPFVLPTWALVCIAIGGSCLVGIAVSKLVEYPMLRLRDRLFPSFISSYFSPRDPSDGNTVSPINPNFESDASGAAEPRHRDGG